ncbi:MAG TPA: sigma-70 family RNA polymerase sigma factor [Pyrinomonadaceae bacterium]|jgi:RNA polymerase sigma factor (TIGR02999 family)
MQNSPDVTQLLIDWSGGDRNALEQLMPLVYRELQRIAHRHLRRESQNHTLQTTALVHEAYLKLVDQTRINWQNRAQFFGVTAQAMRRILIDRARERLSEKRGSGAERISLDDGAIDIRDERAGELLMLDEALQKLAALDPERSRVVELRYFGGLSGEETAEVMNVSLSTVMRHWRVAKAWLYKELAGGKKN